MYVGIHFWPHIDLNNVSKTAIITSESKLKTDENNLNIPRKTFSVIRSISMRIFKRKSKAKISAIFGSVTRYFCLLNRRNIGISAETFREGGEG